MSDERRKLEGEQGIKALGHRAYVGGRWDEIGRLQFEYLIQHGLKPSHVLLDIACGALRGGVHFINYLDPGHYLGLEKESTLVELGIEEELGRAVLLAKAPEFVVSDFFEFDRFSRRPQFSLAQSLFTHLTPDDIKVCLSRLRRFVGSPTLGTVLFATFSEGSSLRNPDKSHSHDVFCYMPHEMAAFGEDSEWKATHLGDWGHPRKQMMMKYETKSAG